MRSTILKIAISSLLGALILSACGSNLQEPETVEISLTEFRIQSSLTTFEAGKPYRFVITNYGSIDHEFTIMPPMPAAPIATDMGMGEMPGMDHNNMPGAILHVEQEQLSAGATVTIEFTFAQSASLGLIEFACHLPGHYEAGMLVPISVNS